MKIVRSTLETITQCVLLPGVELKFDDVVLYLKRGISMGEVIRGKVKGFQCKK